MTASGEETPVSGERNQLLVQGWDVFIFRGRRWDGGRGLVPAVCAAAALFAARSPFALPQRAPAASPRRSHVVALRVTPCVTTHTHTHTYVVTSVSTGRDSYTVIPLRTW